MANAGALGLDSDQVEKIDEMITGHLATAIRDQAEVQAQMVTLRKALRAENIDLKNVEQQLQNIHGKARQLQVDGIRLYTRVLDTLTPGQRDKMRATIGTPFPPPWKKGSHGMTGSTGMPMDEPADEPDGQDTPEHAHGTSPQ
jgi:hypothetical protein